MEENIEDIAKSIKIHRDYEIASRTTNNAVGRSMTLYNNREEKLWLINKQATVVRFQTDLNGNPIIETGFAEETTYQGDGFPIPRDSKLGGLLIQNHEGTHRYQTPQGEIEIEIFNRASYNPSNFDTEYATDILILLSGDKRTFSYKNIFKILSLQSELKEVKKKLEHATDQETEQLIKRITDKEKEMKEYLDKAQGFIRKYAELRYQPILDPIQESIKRSKIFDGTLIINGGPGTGKTTSLIQRIKFLISPSIEEYKNLNQSQKDVLFNQKTSWIFYSPNELLALFLSNSMTKEELAADKERVKVWSSHKNELVKAYKLVDTATQRPFRFYIKSEVNSLFINKSKNIQEIISGLNKFYLDFQKEKLNKVAEIDVSPFKWKNTGKSIQKYLNDKKNDKNIDELIRVFLNLNETFKSESEKIAEEYSTLIKKVAGRIQINIAKDVDRLSVLSDLLKQWKNSHQEMDEENDDDDMEIELEDFEEKVEQTDFDFERELFTKLKSLCRKQALEKFDKNTKFTKREVKLKELIKEIGTQKEYEQIGEIAFFKKYFERITKGIIPNVLREIPMTYKKFRRIQLISKNKNWNLQILDELVKIDNNSRIHYDEQALLLHFINTICLSLTNSFPSQSNNQNHPYLNSYKNNCKPVIGIDEATDFSIIDLLAIYSFRHPEISSVTLSGDIMQRMTNEGLLSWEDISSLISDTKKMDLELSYRQSPTLLSLAKSIYEKSTNTKANYKSYIEKDEAEPKPLIIVSNNDEEKLKWIAKRIIEIYRAYGDSIPSIAIFLPNENQLEGFARELGNQNLLSDVGILVKACRNGEVLGDNNTVRVFSIDKIKGLEFEAVFFHNLDELQNQNLSNDLLLKYLYVGLSRATFYLGLTVSEELNRDLNFIVDYFDRSGNTWGK